MRDEGTRRKGDGTVSDVSVLEAGLLLFGIHLILQVLWCAYYSFGVTVFSTDSWMVFNLLFSVVDICIGGFLLMRGALAYGITLSISGILFMLSSIFDISVLTWSILAFFTIYLVSAMVFCRHGSILMCVVCSSLSVFTLCKLILSGSWSGVSLVFLLVAAALVLFIYNRAVYTGIKPDLYLLKNVDVESAVLLTFGEFMFSLSMITYLAWVFSDDVFSDTLARIVSCLCIVSVAIWCYGIYKGFLAEGLLSIMFCLEVLSYTLGWPLGLMAPDIFSVMFLLPMVTVLFMYHRSRQYALMIIIGIIIVLDMYQSITVETSLIETMITMSDVAFLIVYLYVWYGFEASDEEVIRRYSEKNVSEVRCDEL